MRRGKALTNSAPAVFGDFPLFFWLMLWDYFQMKGASVRGQQKTVLRFFLWEIFLPIFFCSRQYFYSFSLSLNMTDTDIRLSVYIAQFKRYAMTVNPVP